MKIYDIDKKNNIKTNKIKNKNSLDSLTQSRKHTKGEKKLLYKN